MKSFLAATGIAALVALLEQGALSTPVARAPALKVELSGPQSVSSTSDLKITAKVTNTGSSPLKVLNFNTPLKGSKVNNFVVSKEGSDVAFKGLKVQFNPKSDSAFTTIGAGESVSVDHEIGALYDFAAAGEGKYKIEASKEFAFVDANAKAASLAQMQGLTATSSTLEVEVTGDLKAASLTPTKKRDTTQDCSADQSKFIFSSLSEAVELAQAAVDYIGSNDADQLFKDYFGTNTPSEVSDGFTQVTKIDAEDSGKGTPWSCADPYQGCEEGVIAYTVPSTGDGAFCDPFFEETTTDKLCSGDTTVEDRNIRAGTSLHEYTHLLIETDDFGYGVDFDKNLAATKPDQALKNADNYNTFATEAYLASKC